MTQKKKLKRKIKLILAFFIILLSSSPNSFAQAEEIQNPNKGVIDYPWSPRFPDLNFDPATNYGDLQFIALSYEGLVTKDLTNTNLIIGLLATNWTISSDGKTYTFSLRKGVYYHDGKPFNAYTMKYSLDRLMIINDLNGPAYLLQEYIVGAPQLMQTSNVNVTQANVYLNAKGINVIDDYTLEIKLIKPFNSLLNLLINLGYAVSPYSVITNRPANYSTNQADDTWGMVSLSTMFSGLTDWTKLGLEPNHNPEVSGIVPQSDRNSLTEHVWMTHNMIGTGPYKLNNVNMLQVQFVKNNNWAGAFAINSVDEIIYNYEPNIYNLDFNFKSGATDYLESIMVFPDYISSYIDITSKKSIVEGVNAYIRYTPSVLAYGFNVSDSISTKFVSPALDIEKTWNETHIINDHLVRYNNNNSYLASINNPFSSLKFRQAFSMAMDYETLIAESYYNIAVRAEGIIPYGVTGHQDQLIEEGFVPTFNVEKSKEFFQEVGWRGNITLYNMGTPKGMRTVFTLLVQSAIDSMNVGININVKTVSIPEYGSEVKNFPLWDFQWYDDYEDPLNSIYPYYYSKGLFAKRIQYDNPMVDSLINQVKDETNSNKRIDLIRQIEENVTSDYVYLYMLNWANLVLTRNWLYNVDLSGSLDPFTNGLKFQYISKGEPSNTTTSVTTSGKNSNTPNFDVLVLLIVFTPLALMKLKKKR